MKTLIILIILLPTLCQANGILFKPGFIQDAADERNVYKKPLSIQVKPICIKNRQKLDMIAMSDYMDKQIRDKERSEYVFR